MSLLEMAALGVGLLVPIVVAVYFIRQRRRKAALSKELDRLDEPVVRLTEAVAELDRAVERMREERRVEIERLRIERRRREAGEFRGRAR